MSFFFNHTTTTEIYTLSLHDGSSDLIEASPQITCTLFFFIRKPTPSLSRFDTARERFTIALGSKLTFSAERDRKSTRLNSSHSSISYAVFCLKKKTTMKRCYVRMSRF